MGWTDKDAHPWDAARAHGDWGVLRRDPARGSGAGIADAGEGRPMSTPDEHFSALINRLNENHDDNRIDRNTFILCLTEIAIARELVAQLADVAKAIRESRGGSDDRG